MLNVQGDTVLAIAASNDGKIWTYSNYIYDDPYVEDVLLYKSPGPLSQNWAGPFQYGQGINYANVNFLVPIFAYTSYPVIGWFNGSPTIVYDEDRKCLYTLTIENTPVLSQNMTLKLRISGDNGMTIEKNILVSTSDKNNRGIQTMALDPIQKFLSIGFYDGRLDPTGKTVNYFRAKISKRKLDKWTKNIPKSNTVFTVDNSI
jgi:hypothetical protein